MNETIDNNLWIHQIIGRGLLRVPINISQDKAIDKLQVYSPGGGGGHFGI